MELCWLKLSWLVFVTLTCAAPLDDNESNKDNVDYRLESLVLPSHYDVLLKPYLNEENGLKRFTFDGQVDISISTAADNVKSIVLHKKNLDITETTLKPDEGSVVTLKPVDETETDKTTITLTEALKKGVKYTLSFKYTGKLGDDMHGFYKSYYLNENGTEVLMASTQLQPVHARRVFPCFDEPKYKATFTIKINRHKSYTTVSNTKMENSVQDGADRFIDIYKKTPIMSTYLIAFMVSNFKKRENTLKDFSVIARPGAYDQTEYSYKVGPQLLKKLDVFTDFPYSTMNLEKMDLAAIPDFSAGAMENWGLLTYRETALLHDPKVSTKMAQQRIASVIAHEQAHMWFGDLVTCDWWGVTWLNEGFARYFQYFIPHEIYPEWGLEKQFVVEQIQSVFNMDSLKNTHPMTDTTVKSPSDIARMFGSISYNKGASIIRMIKHAMGESNFKTALQKYLKDRQYKTAMPEQLFSFLNKEHDSTKFDLTPILEDWTKQVGYPVVTITIAEDSKSMTLTQNRFLLQKDAGDETLLWTIPFTYATSQNKDFLNTVPSLTLEKTKSEKKVPFDKEVKWVIGNVQQTGYYRVNYDIKTWNNIHHALADKDFSTIHELNRAQIVDDLLNFGRSGLVDYGLVFGVLGYLEYETSYLPWYSAFNGFSTLAIRLGKENHNLLAREILLLINNIYDRLGFDEKPTDERLDIYNRANVLSWACKYGHSDCIKKSKEYYKKFIGGNAVPVNIRPSVYCTAIREGSAADFDFLWTKFESENVATEKVLILTALGCSKSEPKIKEYLANIMSTKVRLQDKSSAVSGAYSGNIENVDVVFKYVIINYNTVKTAFGEYSDVASILSNVASRFTTKQQLEALEKFHTEHKEEFGAAASKRLETAIETTKENLKWSEEYLPKLLKYLQVNGDSASTNSISLMLSVVIVLFNLIRYY